MGRSRGDVAALVLGALTLTLTLTPSPSPNPNPNPNPRFELVARLAHDAIYPARARLRRAVETPLAPEERDDAYGAR